jgi:hypothetical protein
MKYQNRLIKTLLLASLSLAPSAWAQSPQLTHALDQVQAAQASYQTQNTQEASAHTRAALGHVEILRREHKADKSLKTAEANLSLSLKQNKNEAYDKSAKSIGHAMERLEEFRTGQE